MRPKLFFGFLVAALVVISFGSPADAGHRTVRGPTGVIKYDQANTQPGYLTFATGRNAWLVDMEGYIVHTWTAEDSASLVPVLTHQGHVLLTGGTGQGPTSAGGDYGYAEEQDWDGNHVRYFYPPTVDARGTPRQHVLHHRMYWIPDVGSPLYGYVSGADRQVYTQAEGIAAGRTRQTAATFQPDAPTVWNNANPPQVVWQFQFFDELGTGYNKVDPNLPTSDVDFVHINAVTYDSVRNWILISSNSASELYAVDYNTKKIVYRFGNPANWDSTKQYATANAARMGAISLNDRWFFNNHDVRPTVPASGGTIMIWNNGNFPTGLGGISYEINPELDKVTWRWPGVATATTANNGADPTIYGGAQSGSNRMPNGNTVLYMATGGHSVEVTPSGSVVWEYKLPTSSSGSKCFYNQLEDNYSWHAAVKYPANFPGFAGRDLVTGRYKFKSCPYDGNPEWTMAEPADPPAPTVTILGAREYIPPTDLLLQVQIDGTEKYDVYFDFQLPGSTARFYVYDVNLARLPGNARVYLEKNVPAGTYTAFQFPFRSLGTDYTVPVRCQVYRAGYTQALTTATGTVTLRSY